MRAFLTRQESAHLRDWVPATMIAFAAMVAQANHLPEQVLQLLRG